MQRCHSPGGPPWTEVRRRRPYTVDFLDPPRKGRPVNTLPPDSDPVPTTPPTASQRVIAAFDKYNLVTLPVVDHANRLIGVITADDIIAVLRQS